VTPKRRGTRAQGARASTTRARRHVVSVNKQTGERTNEGKERAGRCRVHAHRKFMQCKHPGKAPFVSLSLALFFSVYRVFQCAAMFSSVLQCFSVCCSVFQCVAVCCRVLYCLLFRPFLPCSSVLRCVVVCCRAFQCGAVCCRVFQCVAVCCSALHRLLFIAFLPCSTHVLQYVAVCCNNVLQCVAMCYS